MIPEQSNNINISQENARSDVVQPIQKSGDGVYRRPAGFWIRVLAYFIDGIVLLPLMGLLWLGLNNGSPTLRLLPYLAAIFYKPILEALYGATLGKKFVGIEVISEEGGRISLPQAFLRNSLFGIRSLLNIFIIIDIPDVAQTTFLELGQLTQGNPLTSIRKIVAVLAAGDCMAIVFFPNSKKTIHDLFAATRCVYTKRSIERSGEELVEHSSEQPEEKEYADPWEERDR